MAAEIPDCERAARKEVLDHSTQEGPPEILLRIDKALFPSTTEPQKVLLGQALFTGRGLYFLGLAELDPAKMEAGTGAAIASGAAGGLIYGSLMLAQLDRQARSAVNSAANSCYKQARNSIEGASLEEQFLRAPLSSHFFARSEIKNQKVLSGEPPLITTTYGDMTFPEATEAEREVIPAWWDQLRCGCVQDCVADWTEAKAILHLRSTQKLDDEGFRAFLAKLNADTNATAPWVQKLFSGLYVDHYMAFIKQVAASGEFEQLLKSGSAKMLAVTNTRILGSLTALLLTPVAWVGYWLAFVRGNEDPKMLNIILLLAVGGFLMIKALACLGQALAYRTRTLRAIREAR